VTAFAPARFERALWTVLATAGPGAVLSHESAAAVWALDGVLSRGPVTVTVPHRRTVRPPPGSVVHRSRHLDRGDVVRRDGLPVTSPARTLADLAASLPTAALERAVVDALRRRLTTADRVSRVADRLRPRDGIDRLRKVLARLDPGLESVLEEDLLRLLLARGLPEPVRQFELRDPAGRFVARPDLAYPAYRLAVEAMGHTWHSAPDDWQRDLRRHNAVTAAGWRYQAFSAADIRERPAYVVAAVRRELSGKSLVVSKSHELC
jgi:very-short-patch-repair endonuclease